MSSTNRGYDRHVADYYVTPKEPIRIFLKSFMKNENINNPQSLDWLDPCCGGDANNDASYLSVIKEKYNPPLLTGIDIREDSHAEIIMDFLASKKENFNEHDFIISNPPFYLAEDFIRKSIELASDGGYVVMLLRLNFFGSEKRKALFDEFMPVSCYIHRNRINFIPDSMKGEMKLNGIKPPSGDSIEYAHFVWQKGVFGNYCKTYII